jgi:outer membrane lipase/esterase
MAGLSATPSLLGGTNYAYGGAVTGIDQILHPNFPQFPLPSLKTQANTFLTAPGAVDISTALFVVAGGGNNARATFSNVAALTDFGLIGSTMTSAAASYANDVGGIVDQLQAAGAQNIIVWNTPNIGLAPAIKAAAPFTASGLTGVQLGSMVSGSNNGALMSRLTGEAGVQIFDLYGLVAQASANGFTNTTDACGASTNSAVCPTNIANALFWDGIHPTTAAHGLIAQQMFALAAPVPEPSTYAMMLVGLLVITRVVRRRAS